MPKTRTTSQHCGAAVIDKAEAMTSHDVVARARKALGERRIGHGGTLDPDATGVLVLGVGRATRLLRYVSELDKAYVGEVVFGTSTSTLDASGSIVATFEMGSITLDHVRRAAHGLVGEIDQIPPMVSAIKVDGERLYTLARAGIEVERAPRRVTISRLEVDPTDERNVFRICVECSSGTYVRSIAADLGSALGGGAHLRHLRRTRIGAFLVEDALALEDLSPEGLLAPSVLVDHLESVTVDCSIAAGVMVGKVYDTDTLGVKGRGPWAVVAPTGELLAIYEHHRDHSAKPALVMGAPQPH